MVEIGNEPTGKHYKDYASKAGLQGEKRTTNHYATSVTITFHDYITLHNISLLLNPLPFLIATRDVAIYNGSEIFMSFPHMHVQAVADAGFLERGFCSSIARAKFLEATPTLIKPMSIFKCFREILLALPANRSVFDQNFF